MNVAIIGLSLRLPNEINNLEDLYDRLKNKIDCISEHPADRFHMESFYDSANSIGKMNTKRAGYIKDVYNFDNSFFKISNKEARTTDPQQRIMLELVYEALQNSRISIEECKNSNTGVYMGSCNTEYFSKQTEDAEWCNDYSLPGGLLTLLSNRISYFYDFKGPSMTLDTACSSSGHALHLACQSLTRGETDRCIVGGSNLLLNPETTVGFSQGKFLAPDGKCKAFDEMANGYVRSEGCVVFVLERLEEAIEKNRHIYAVIKKTAVNQDGKTDSITMPNGDLQMELLQQIYEGVNLDDITYIEAHGTGTKVGDKIETNSIGTVLGKQRSTALPIGSIKSALGHTEATSGLAALCKIILMMEKRELLPNQHFHVPSTNIDFKTLNLKVVTESVPITKERIIMGVNNYGFGGSNFHCMIENYIMPPPPEVETATEAVGLHLLCVTSNDEESIDKNVMPYLLNENEEDFLKYVYNQNCATDLFEEAKIYIVENQKDFQTQILNPNKVKDLSVVYGKRNVTGTPNICFVFCGQGPQFVDMGRDYISRFPVFREKIVECDAIWKRISGYSFLAEYGLFTEKAQADIPINDPIVAQPAIAFFQIALFHLYKSFGILPNTVIGHSAGEQAAFYASGAITLEDTIKLSYYRSIYQQQTAGLGNMLVINQNIETIDTLLQAHPTLELAVINSNMSFVFAGPTTAIDTLKTELTENGISAIKIAGRCPFHSSLQESIKENILKFTNSIVFREPSIELISTVTGYPFQKEDYTADYWWNNIRNVVRFYEGIDQCSNADIFIEIAPHIVLTSNIQAVHKEALVLYSAHRKEDSARRFLSTLAKLYLCGASVDMSVFGHENTTHYPVYQWNKKLHFQEPKSSYNRRHNIIQKLNTIRFSPNKYPYVKDHIIGGKPILPTVTYIDLIRTYIMTNENRIENLTIHSMYDITAEDIEFMVNQTNNTYTFMSLDNKTKYLSFTLEQVRAGAGEPVTTDNFNLLLKSATVLEKSDLIEILKSKNFNFGNKMFAFKRGYLGDVFKNDILIEIDESVRVDLIYPTVLDVCLTSNMMIPLQGITNHYQYLPTSIENITFHSIGQAKYVYTCGVFDSKKHYICHSHILSADFKLLISFENIKSINVSNTNTQIYTPKHVPVEIPEKSADKKIKYEIIDTNDLLKIRDVLFENKNVVYLMDIEVNYEVIGFVRSLLNEIKDVKFKVCYYRIIDNLINKLTTCPWTNIEYFYDGNSFTEIKLEKATPHFELPDYYLHYTNKGSLQNLKYMYKSFTPLKTGEVRVKIHASALNFKDIAVMFDLVKDNTIGYEFSGTVEESLSPHFRPGDRIFGTNTDTGNCIGNTVITPDKYIWHTPDCLDDITAAGFSLSFGTAYLALVEYGRVRPEDVVLIHSATGALGLAAIEICKTIGCKVIATAGTEDKRAYLRQITNVDFVTDSRSNKTYQKDILEYTNGKGVDVVLAATIGEAMSTNIKLLKPRGKYLDVGKKLIYEKGGLPLEHFLKSIQYHSIHFDELLRTQNDYIRAIVSRVCELVTTEKIDIFPIIKTSIENIKQTFTEFSKSNHTGKYVCIQDNDFRPTECLFPAEIFNSVDYYLITGGLGGLGLELMHWMKQYGARKFLVTSRQTLTEEMRVFFERKQLDVTVIQTDLLDYEALNRQLQPYKIDGVFHLAGMIKDKMAKTLNPEDIPAIINVKKYGLENLGRIFSDRLSYFVAFSSIVALIGNPGQSTYAAANSYMDEYCNRRKLNGLPALSINLGAIGGCGMICTNFQLGRTMMANGINFTVYHDLFDRMKEVLLDKTLSQVCITNQDWNSLSDLKTKPLFQTFLKNEIETNESTSAEQEARMEKKLIDFLNSLLDTKELDIEKNLISYGVDSIMSMEIANWCRDQLNIPIKQIDILQGITIREILKKTKNSKEQTVKPTDHTNKFIFNLKTKINHDTFEHKEEDSSSSIWRKMAFYGLGIVAASSYYFVFEK